MKEAIREINKVPLVAELAIVAANIIPILGIMVFDWPYFYILLLYWLESGIIGVSTILKMKKVPDKNYEKFMRKRKEQESLGQPAGQSLWILFFIIHFGGFMFGHLIGIIQLFGPKWSLDYIFNLVLVIIPTLVVLVIGHLISFYNNIEEQDFTEKNPKKIMFSPYSRVVVMHLILLAIPYFVSMSIGIAFSILIKTGVDIKVYEKEKSDI